MSYTSGITESVISVESAQTDLLPNAVLRKRLPAITSSLELRAAGMGATMCV